MPGITFTVATHDALPVALPPGSKDADQLSILQGACEAQDIMIMQGQVQGRREILQSSLDEPTAKATLRHMVPCSNGFVHAVLKAYASHHHLHVRPDDVWLAILTQLSFYVNAHAEELRQYFVAHQGKETLSVLLEDCDYNYGAVARAFAKKIDEKVVDKTLVEWILPDFTTTTTTDMAICSIVMMSTLQSYFNYFCGIICGIPSVTLFGEKADWERLYRRLDRLPELGDEPATWAGMLRPILRRFVSAFDGTPDRTFWGHVVRCSREVCGQDDFTGWLTAFCVWSPTGKWLPLPILANVLPKSLQGEQVMSTPDPVVGQDGRKDEVRGHKRASLVRRLASSLKRRFKIPPKGPIVLQDSEEEPSTSTMIHEHHTYFYSLDGVVYPIIDYNDIPSGYAEVKVAVGAPNGPPCTMLAGHVAYIASAKEKGGVLDTISPSPQWFMYRK